MTFNPSQARVPKGQAGGGRFGGTPRNSAAAKAQSNKAAVAAGDKLAATAQNQRSAYLKTLSDDDLKALCALAYSHPSSDASVVQMRLQVAAEMGKRGFDIKQFGALGGGITARGKGAIPPARMAKVASAAKAARKVPARAPVKAKAAPAKAPATSGGTFRARAN